MHLHWGVGRSTRPRWLEDSFFFQGNGSVDWLSNKGGLISNYQICENLIIRNSRALQPKRKRKKKTKSRMTSYTVTELKLLIFFPPKCGISYFTIAGCMIPALLLVSTFSFARALSYETTCSNILFWLNKFMWDFISIY